MSFFAASKAKFILVAHINSFHSITFSLSAAKAAKDDEDGDCGPSQIFRCVCGSERRTNIFANDNTNATGLPACEPAFLLALYIVYRCCCSLPKKKPIIIMIFRAGSIT
jgi:hypothetical protein